MLGFATRPLIKSGSEVGYKGPGHSCTSRLSDIRLFGRVEDRDLCRPLGILLHQTWQTMLFITFNELVHRGILMPEHVWAA